MKKKRFSVEQITAVLQQVSGGMPVGDVCRQVGVSEQTFYRWKKAYAGMRPNEARELKQLRDENIKLKRVIADLSLDKVHAPDVVAIHRPPSLLAVNGGRVSRELVSSLWIVK